MKYDLSTYEGKTWAVRQFNEHVKNGDVIELKKSKVNVSGQQGRAMHLYFKFISDELREMGAEFTYTGLKGMDISCPYTPHIVKEFFWKPIQMTLFEKESTTELTTDELNEVIQIVNKWFAEKGIVIAFPSYESLQEHIK